VAIRFDDTARTLTLSVLDIVERGILSGHLTVDVVQASTTRMAQGRVVHEDYQAMRGADDDSFRAEVRLKHIVGIGDWSVALVGRVDGLSTEGEFTVVEEVKSTALPASALYPTTAESWPRYLAQLEVYLWMLDQAKHPNPVGRLVLVSLLDGVRHVIAVSLDRERLDRFVLDRLEHLVEQRERRLEWLEARRTRAVPAPFSTWRPGQQDVVEVVGRAVAEGGPLLVEAPTGLGKTAAVMVGVLRHAFKTDKQVFWATARTTHQEVVERTAGLLGVRIVTITAREKACVNDVVACRPEACVFARSYFDKLHAGDLIEKVLQHDGVDRLVLRDAGLTHEVCPYQLGVDAVARADLVVGDYNYAFDPGLNLERLFGDSAADWIVVVDEAHQLVERARGYGSPRLPASLARAAEAALAPARYERFAELAAEVAQRIEEATELVDGALRDGMAQVELSRRPWMDLADAIDEVGLGYARNRAEHPLFPPGETDPWIELSRAVLRFARTLASAGDETAHLVNVRHAEQAVSLLCLDPSGWLGPRLRAFGGLVGCSATLSPLAFYRDLLGLDDVEHVAVPSPFPAENRRIVLAPRVSTMYRDRRAHAHATATVMARCIEAMPGNALVFFPSFAMLRDIAARWTFTDRELLMQGPSMSEDDRRALLERMGSEGRVVLAAVLGGIFAEGIDLPAGAVAGVLVAGPALPPVGLERDLLRACYEERYGEGFAYASLIPGMTKVVQAAGRLVRRPEDRGVVVLVGKRFRWRDIASLLPADWEPVVPNDPAVEVASFWSAP
jgi:DNA excision repair protein ERCC-2